MPLSRNESLATVIAGRSRRRSFAPAFNWDFINAKIGILLTRPLMYSFSRESIASPAAISRDIRARRVEERFYFSGIDFMNSLIQFNCRALVFVTCRQPNSDCGLV
jgi:hypothetical protein